MCCCLLRRLSDDAPLRTHTCAANAYVVCVVLLGVLSALSSPVNCAHSRKEVENSPTKEKHTLELVHVLFRHGPRTPVNTYPNDPHVNETFSPYGWGQLTNDAKVKLYKIGKSLRKRYARLLGPQYTSEVISAKSSASPRTVMSMQMVLAGMFPPENTALEWNYLLNWQPVPIFTEPADTDLLLRQAVQCPRYEEALEEVMSSAEVLEQHEPYEDMLQELSTITGTNVSNAHDVSSLYITLLAELAYGLPLPAWTKDYFPLKMQPLAAQAYLYNVYTTEMRKLKGGFFLQHMFKQMQQKVANTLEPRARRAFLYCAHDWSVANILSALNVWKLQMPNFSALMAFELHKNHETDKHYVEIYFQNDHNKEPEKLTVPGCEFQCPLEKLIKLAENVLPDKSYEELCRQPSSSHPSTEGALI